MNIYHSIIMFTSIYKIVFVFRDKLYIPTFGSRFLLLCTVSIMVIFELCFYLFHFIYS